MKRAIADKDTRIASLEQESLNWQSKLTKLQKNNRRLKTEGDAAHLE